MSDAIVTTLGVVFVALMNLVGLIIVGRNASAAALAAKSAVAGVASVAETVVDIKKQTDGLTSALVKKTEEKANSDIDAARLAGIEEQRLAGERDASKVEEGRRLGMEAAVAQALPASLPASGGKADVPVADARVGAAVEQIAEATGAVAEAAEKLGEKT